MASTSNLKCIRETKRGPPTSSFSEDVEGHCKALCGILRIFDNINKNKMQNKITWALVCGMNLCWNRVSSKHMGAAWNQEWCDEGWRKCVSSKVKRSSALFYIARVSWSPCFVVIHCSKASSNPHPHQQCWINTMWQPVDTCVCGLCMCAHPC